MDIFGILASGMQGAREGMDRQRENMRKDELMAMQRDDQSMQKRQFELQMKQLGLALENAQYEHDVKIAQGTPKEVAARELAAKQVAIAQDAEKFGLYKRLTESQISENDAQAAAANARASGSGQSEKIDTRFTEAAKLVSQKLKILTDQRDAVVAAGKDPAAIDAEIKRVYDTEYEPLIGAQLQQYGVSFDQPSTDKETPPVAPAPEQPKVPYMDRVNRAAGESYGAGVKEAFSPVGNAVGSAANATRPLLDLLMPTLFPGYQPGPNGPQMYTPNGQGVRMNFMGQPQIQRMQQQGLIQPTQPPQAPNGNQAQISLMKLLLGGGF